MYDICINNYKTIKSVLKSFFFSTIKQITNQNSEKLSESFIPTFHYNLMTNEILKRPLQPFF